MELGENKNLKDTSKNTISSSSKRTEDSGSRSYTKTAKLITALYMVTDVMDAGEPLRNKLRTLGTGVISDMNTLSLTPSLSRTMQTVSKIGETLSFLDIAFTISIISEMNYSILKKEFLELKKSLEGSIQNPHLFSGETSLKEFFREELPIAGASDYNKSIGHEKPTRIGVQKGSTLMKALSDRTDFLYKSDSINSTKSRKDNKEITTSFDALRKQRRDEIISIIKTNFNSPNPDLAGATITDVKTKATGPVASCGEKTLQRELISMVKDGVLKKTGQKRWSKYFVPSV